MLEEVGADYENVYHIDCRGVTGEDDWYDELHPKSKIFRKIARTYKQCIENKVCEKKVYRVVNE